MTKSFRAGLLLAILFGAALLVVLYRNGQNGRYQMQQEDGDTVLLNTRTGEVTRYDWSSFTIENGKRSMPAPD